MLVFSIKVSNLYILVEGELVSIIKNLIEICSLCLEYWLFILNLFFIYLIYDNEFDVWY